VLVAEEPQPDGQLDELNEFLRDQPFKLAVVNTADLLLLEKNARFMRHETFMNLVKNIKRDGALSSIPFCWYDGAVFHVLSGNHRVLAAREAGIDRIMVQYTDADMTRQERVATQLSHNAIVGEDDVAILKELWEELTSVGDKLYAGLDDKVMDMFKDVALLSLSEVRLDFRTIAFAFLPEEPEALQDAFEEAKKSISLKDGHLARLEEFDRLLDSLARAQQAYGVHNSATSLLIILDIFNHHPEDLQAGWLGEDDEIKHKGWVPLASILGEDTMPAEAALVVKQAVDKMQNKKEVESKSRWRALEMWAADYLAGV